MHEKRVIAVTGAGGFLGSVLAAAFEKAGHRVVRLSRPVFRLGEPVSPEALRGVEALVHAAYDFTLTRPADIRRVNVEGTRKLFSAAVAAGVPAIVQISSVAAWDGAVSRYGRAKAAIEKMAFGLGAWVVRPGIAYDDAGGGIMPKLAMLARLPLVPLFDRGDQPVLTTHADDLARLLLAVVEAGGPAPRAPIVAAHPRIWPFRELLAVLARRQGRSPRFLRIPSFLPLAMLRSLEAVGLRPPMRSDALVGLLTTDPRPDFSRSGVFGIGWRPFDI